MKTEEQVAEEIKKILVENNCRLKVTKESQLGDRNTDLVVRVRSKISDSYSLSGGAQIHRE